MEALDNDTFEAWMHRLMQRFDRYEHLLSMQDCGNGTKAAKRKPALWEGEYLLDNQDLCMLLQVSKRSLQRYRSLGILPYLSLRQKTYYKESDVIRFLSEHARELRKDAVEYYKARIHQYLNS